MFKKTIISVLFALALGCGALWWQSEWGVYEAGGRHGKRSIRQQEGWKQHFDLTENCGITFYGHNGVLSLHAHWQEDWVVKPPVKTIESNKRFGHFSFGTFVVGPLRSYSISTPFWALVILFSAYPATALIRGPLRRSHRRKRNQCLHCGYKLTGLTESRCPECGRPTKTI